MEGQNGNTVVIAVEELSMLRMKAFVYDCIHEEETLRNRRQDVNAEIERVARANQTKPQPQPAPAPRVEEPAGVEG